MFGFMVLHESDGLDKLLNIGNTDLLSISTKKGTLIMPLKVLVHLFPRMLVPACILTGFFSLKTEDVLLHSIGIENTSLFKKISHSVLMS